MSVTISSLEDAASDPAGVMGKGSYWTLDASAFDMFEQGNYRRRRTRRQRQSKNAGALLMDMDRVRIYFIVLGKHRNLIQLFLPLLLHTGHDAISPDRLSSSTAVC